MRHGLGPWARHIWSWAQGPKVRSPHQFDCDLPERTQAGSPGKEPGSEMVLIQVRLQSSEIGLASVYHGTQVIGSCGTEPVQGTLQHCF